MFAEQRTTTGWQIVLLAANAFGSAIKSIYCPLPKSPCHPSVHSSVHSADPSSFVLLSSLSRRGVRFLRMQNYQIVAAAACRTHDLSNPYSNFGQCPFPSPPSCSATITPPPLWLLSLVVAIVRCNIGNICLRFRFIFIELQKIGSPRLVANLEPRLQTPTSHARC